MKNKENIILENDITKAYDEIINLGNNVSDKLKNNTLTDKDIEDITNTLENNISDKSKILREIQSNDIDKNNIIEGYANVEYDNTTGEAKVLSPLNDNNNNISLSDVIDGTDDIKISEATEESMNTVFSQFGMSDNEVLSFINVINKHKEGKRISYMELPEMVQSMVGTFMSADPKIKRPSAIKQVLDFFVTEAEKEQTLVDFQESLTKELNLPGMVDLYSEHIKEQMEIKLPEIAYRLKHDENNPNPKKAEDILNISDAFTDTYNFFTINKYIDSNSKEFRKLNKDLRSFKHFDRSFLMKYEDHKLIINDPKMIINTIRRVYKEKYSIDTIKKFLILFYKITLNYSPNNLAEHTFMYYTIKNILSLDFLEHDNNFREELYNNLDIVLSKLL